MYNMVVLLALTTQVTVDHLTDWRGPVCFVDQPSALYSLMTIHILRDTLLSKYTYQGTACSAL
jgi:hypothetical protein